jgi:hypothetical protein
MKQTFEENDAGFQYVIDKKGKQAYNLHNQLFESRITSTKNNFECAEMLNEWLQFFRTGHIGIEVLKNDWVENSQETVQTFSDWKKIEMDTIAFKTYLDTKKDFDLEGIWQDEVYTVGIKKMDNQFVGFIIDSQAKEWEKSQIKFRIYPDSVLYYMRNHALNKLQKAHFASKNLLLFGNFSSFRRIYPEYEDKFMNVLIDEKSPHLEQLNASTLYLRIPSFHNENKELIDSILWENYTKIISIRNLIIDLRYNGGGDDVSWANIIPVIYTNPIRQKSCYFWSSKMNNPILKEYRGEDFYEQLNQNLGSFVLLFGEKYFTQHSLDTVRTYPKNVAVLINKYCASSTEQFLLAAKQSSKVKIFGTPTAGALDFSNINRVESPCGNFKLYYAMSKDVDIEDYPIDNIGIQPDFYLDDEIPDYKWIEYVNDILHDHFD